VPDIDHVGQDLGYVRGLLERSEPRSPPAIYVLWAVVVLVGFTLTDLAPTASGLFWLIAAPVGFLVSTWLGARAAKKEGQVDRAEGDRHFLHWGGLLAALVLIIPLAWSKAVTGPGAGQVTLLVVALAYYLEGVHQERPNLWVGLAIAAGYLLTFVVTRHAWLLVGVIISAALLVSAFQTRARPSRTSPAPASDAR
jgi:hypothetical protein